MKGLGISVLARQTLPSPANHSIARASRIGPLNTSINYFHCNSLKYAAGPRSFATNARSKQSFTSAVAGPKSFFSSRTSSYGPSTKPRPYTSEDIAQPSRTESQLSRSHTILTSSSSSWGIAFFCGALTTAVIYLVYPARDENHQKRTSRIVDQASSFPGPFLCNTMSGETLPGRPGTLTAEEEEKLKEFWVAVAQVAGIIEQDDNENGSAPDTPSRSDTASSGKDKKKKKGLFRRKKEKEEPSSSNDSDDKYGQTKEFHDAIASMSPELLRTTFWSMVKHDHPDALLLRFLRARKWDVDKALVMMVSTMRWRAMEMHVDDDIMKNGEGQALIEETTATDPTRKNHAHGFLEQMRLGKSFLHGLDKHGRPMCIVRARLHKQGEQSEESLERYTVFLIETARMILNPPVDTACIFFDLTGFSLANMDYNPVKFMIKCFEANYPESLGVVIVHKAPWVFQGIWKIIKGWLDPVVAAKVTFTNNVKDLEVYIDKSRILKELDGDEDWTYKYVEPIPGENDLMKDTETRDKMLAERALIFKEFEKATLDWIQGNGDQTAVKAKRNEIAMKMKNDYWKIDPYVRARSFYDRTGMLGPGGVTTFYPTANGTAKAAAAEKPVETTADDVD
ncbi:CRAL protein [Coleophoma cylindrospora]|uniref:CRAL protein n=1 Tax=Coleophoma cylindrospora TaxID=1849047 RepID=A0A3D8R1H1_9HELO|nr:CRAL protein [Coleophoma cylindrospora]